MLDWIGALVDQPAVLEGTTFPPTIATPATFHPGQRAALRLLGSDREQQAAAIAGATHAAGTVVLAPGDVPPAQNPLGSWGGAMGRAAA